MDNGNRFEPRPPDESLFKSDRVYALIDHVEPEAPEPGEPCDVLFDCVDSYWADQRRERRQSFSFAECTEARSSIIRMPTWWKKDFITGGGLAEPGTWLTLYLHNQGSPGDFKIEHYGSISHLPVDRFLSKAEPTPPHMQMALDELTGLQPVDDATEDEIRGVLDGIPTPQDLVAYDVGQGNCNGLRNNCTVSVYFDFGGGTQANLKTYPSSIAFCFSQNPPIILSHWDWDHWASADRHSKAIDSKWVVPRQRLGITHAQHASQLWSKGNLLIWPSTLTDLSFQFGKVQKCTGKGRNDSGLAILAETFDGIRRPTIKSLLPGDARYSVIPDNGHGNLGCLVMTHHGGKAHESFVPAPANPNDSKLICSVGAGNQWHHPLAPTLANHASAHWPPPVRTEKDRRLPRGHVSAATPPDRNLGCGSTQCTLSASK